MNPIIKICDRDRYGMLITDITQETDEYIPENEKNTESLYLRNRFKYSETCTVNIIYKWYTDEDKTYAETYFTDHQCSYLDELHYTLPQDGYYIIYHLILPTKEWLDKEIELNSPVLKKNVYYVDGNTIKLYNEDNWVYEAKGFIKNTLLDPNKLENSTISLVTDDQFSIFYLFDCYITISNSIFKSINVKCIQKNIDTEESFKRDFLWMSINVLKYYIEKGQYCKAQEILEEINYCGGFCNELRLSSSQNSGCGCNK